MISIVVPVFNEAKNIRELVRKLASQFAKKVNWEVVVIDEHSTDGSWRILKELQPYFPLRVFKKVGKKGKAYSLVEGFEKAKGEVLVMIDADLQYPPKAIPQVIKALEDSDVVVANRKNYHHSKIRKAASRIFRYLCGKFLYGINTDIQSGLKAFRREVWETVKFVPKTQWTFDLEFLHRAKEAGYKMVNFDIIFHPRKNGHSKISLFATALEIGVNALLLRTRTVDPLHIPAKNSNSMEGAGVRFKRRRFITHTTLHHKISALRGLVLWQKVTISLLLALVTFGLFYWPLQTAKTLVAVLSTIYFVDVLFHLYLILKSLHFPPEINLGEDALKKIDESKLPLYSILCPLYREAHVLPQFIRAVEDLDWPKEKLDVLLLLEEDDKETLEKVDTIDLPKYIRKIVIPHSLPKTKPKACNFGLAKAKGEYLVIYDAEDIPDPLQLKKAYLAFKKVPRDVICLQAKLNYYNPDQNLLTKLFTAEYSLWFDVTLTGLQSINTTIPLGGTSNHFRTGDLRALQGWDPFNVTEDADLGVRLFKTGYRTAMIDSTTYEEANSRLGNWLRQRSRWIKGYMQTYLVHMRDPIGFIRTNGLHAFIFQLVVGGKIAFMFINPFLWMATISYFALYNLVGSTIESLYPPAIFYMAVTSLVFGNFLFMYYYMIGCAKRGQWSLVKYVFLIPFYWFLVSTAAVVALYQLVVKPHFWEKTVHGFHLAKEEKAKLKEAAQLEASLKKQEKSRRIRELISSGTFAGGVLIAAAIIGNFLNFLYNAYLGRAINIEEFGLIGLIGSFLLFSSFVMSSLSRTITHKSAYFLGKYNTAFKKFWSNTRKKTTLIALAVTVLWLTLSPVLSILFKTKTAEPFLLFAPVWFFAILASVDRGYLSGNLKFKVLAIIVVLEAFIKLLLTIILVETGYTRFIYAAIPIAMSASFLIGWIYAGLIKVKPINTNEEISTSFPLDFFTTSVFTRISIVAFISLDVILAKIFLSPTAAGQYALIALVGKMIFLIGGLFNQFITPLVSRDEGAKTDSRKTFYKLFVASTATSFLTYVAVGLFGFVTAPLLLGDKIVSVVSLLPVYGFGIFSFTTASSIVSWYQIRKSSLFPIVGLLIATAQVMGVTLYHDNLNQIVLVMAATGVASLIVTLFLHFTYETLKSLGRNLKDFAGLFSPTPKEATVTAQSLKILVFNWRDTKHVWSGGAEVYIHEFSKRLVDQGHKVTLFCGNDNKSPRNETIDGVEVVRRGGNYLVYLWAFLYYIFKFRGKYDVIIDSENGIPFFTPLYCRKPVIGLIHHIHLKEVYRRHLPLPLAALAQFLETKIMPFVYSNKRMITVSSSSKAEMEKIGFGKKFPIEVVNPGVDLSLFRPSAKNPNPQILYLGRLKPYKSIDTLIKVMKDIRKQVPNATLTIAGEGESRTDLENLVSQLGLRGVVKFLGRVSEKTKVELFGKAWVVAQPSKSEGWGLTVIEANACATPVVASDIPGLRDSLKNPHSGILVAWDNLEKWTTELTRVLKDKEHRDSLSKYAFKWSRHFSWQKGTEKFLKVMQREAV